MKLSSKFSALLLSAGMALGASTLLAQGPQQGPGGQGGGGHHGGPGGGQQGGGRPGGPGQGGPGQGRNGGNWHSDRNNWNNYYGNDAARWRGRRGRPNFRAGYRIPRSYGIRPVPPGYYSGYAPLPPGYQYGYYDGYVVSYNPTTRIIADVLDLAAAATR